MKLRYENLPPQPLHPNISIGEKNDHDQSPVKRDIGAMIACARKTAGPTQKKISRGAGKTVVELYQLDLILIYLRPSAFDIVLFMLERMVARAPSSTSSSFFCQLSSSSSLTYVLDNLGCNCHHCHCRCYHHYQIAPPS